MTKPTLPPSSFTLQFSDGVGGAKSEASSQVHSSAEARDVALGLAKMETSGMAVPLSIYTRVPHFLVPREGCGYFKQWTNVRKPLPLRGISSTGRDLLDFMQTACLPFNWLWYSREAFMDATGLAPRTLHRAVSELSQHGVLYDPASTTLNGYARAAGIADLDLQRRAYAQACASWSRRAGHLQVGVTHAGRWLRISPEFGWKGKDSCLFQPPEAIGYMKGRSPAYTEAFELYGQHPGVLLALMQQVIGHGRDLVRDYLLDVCEAGTRIKVETWKSLGV